MSSISKSYNPDVLTCLANLSNDEVFTPPLIANKMLDLLPQEIWSDKNIRFLDPVCKSGIFLREIVKRLDIGLRNTIKDHDQRIHHILRNQVFGIAITELTALLSRRTVYCSKSATGKYSITNKFDTEAGNIRFDLVRHEWDGERCKYCGVNKALFDRGEDLESHAYQFIHTERPQDIFNMKFDVIVGNPPYQMNVGVEKENYAIALYQKFVEQAKKLNPRFLTMIVPARWYAGGRGLDEFRNEMLNDDRIRVIVDYPNAVDCFPGVDISGGVCYFLWDRDNRGDCEVVTVKGNDVVSRMRRSLLEKGCETFIRFNESISILRKVSSKREPTFDQLVSPQTPFGLLSSFTDYKKKKFSGAVKVHTVNGVGYIKREQVQRNTQWIKGWKVYISKAYGERGNYPYRFLAKPFIGEDNSCCTQTYLMIGPFKTAEISRNVISYIHTRFFRFFVMMRKNTQDVMRDKYGLVPQQDFSESWTDEKLYKKYGISKAEVEFIESMVKPMDKEDE